MWGRPTGTPSSWVAYYQIGFPHGPKKWQYSCLGLFSAWVACAYGPESVRIRTARRLYPKHIPLVRGCSRKPRLGRRAGGAPPAVGDGFASVRRCRRT